METDRRSFLAGIGGGVATVAGSAPSQAATAPPTATTYATLATPLGYGLGVRTEHGVLDVAAAAKALKAALPTSVDAVIRGEGDVAALARLVADPARSRRFVRPEAEVRFGPCVTAPPKIICIGLNYRAHIEEAKEKAPTTPILFNKYNTSLNAHGGTIHVSAEPAQKFDYEAELVIVMGKGGRNIAEADALDHVFGYCVGQDFSARDLQFSTGQWMVGKTGDGWGPLGPWLVSADQVDPDNLDISCKVNGEVRQASNTRMMIFSCRKLISFISQHMTLEPGDVIFTGTPNGVIVGYPPEKQVWLKAGDRITTEIQGLGTQDIRLT